MKVIVVGGGKVGLRMASLLIANQHAVTVIETNPHKVNALRDVLGTDAVVHGNGCDPAMLERAGARQSDVVAAVTGQDEANLVVASLARCEFGVPRTIARVNNPKNAWLFNEVMGVDVAVNQADLIAHLIVEEMSLGEMLSRAGSSASSVS